MALLLEEHGSVAVEGAEESKALPSAELRLLESACVYASEAIGMQGLQLLLENLTKCQEAIGHIQRRSVSFVICSSSVGDIYVPSALVQSGEGEDEEGTSWILSVVPSQRHKTQWRALSAVRNVDGWKTVENVRRPVAPKAGRKGGYRDRNQHWGTAEVAPSHTKHRRGKGADRPCDSR